MQDDAARVWGGLVRDDYREWRRREFDALRRNSPFDADRFMLEYCTHRVGVSASPLRGPIPSPKLASEPFLKL